MEQKRDLAIVLRWVPYEERHRIVTALTENHGRITALARNSIQSRRFGGALEPFSASEWRFVERRGAELFRIEEATIRRSFDSIRTDFEAFSLASVFNETMLRIAPEHEPCPDLFKVLSNALAALEELLAFEKADPIKAPKNARIGLLNAYLAKILQWSGSQPQLDCCFGCQTSLHSLDPHHFVTCRVAEAAWLCPDCRGTRQITHREGQAFSQFGLRVTPAALRDFYSALVTPMRQIVPTLTADLAEQTELFQFMEALFVYHIPGFDRSQMKSLRFLNLSPGSSSGSNVIF